MNVREFITTRWITDDQGQETMIAEIDTFLLAEETQIPKRE